LLTLFDTRCETSAARHARRVKDLIDMPDPKDPAHLPAHSPRGAQPARRQASDFDPELLRLFDAYVHGFIGRRRFLEGAAKFAVAGATAVGLLEALSPRFAEAEQVPATDARIKSEYVELDSPQGNGKVRGYLVRPAKPGGKLPAVLVVHENRGLNPHIEDVTRRVALEKFLAFAPDALFPLGGYPGDEDKARELFSKLDQQKTREDFIASAHFLEKHPLSNGKLGVVGFCYGGGIAHMLATRLPELAAAVPFYGSPPPPEAAAQVKAALLVHLAEQDDRINAAWPAYEDALKTAGVKFEVFKYPGTQHGFHNDTTPRYDETSAKLAWQRTIALFNHALRGKAHGPHPAKSAP
jgi:carboxymethylenebutenolidase